MQAMLTNHEFWNMMIIPILIILARICDVSLGTLRIIFLSRGMKLLAPLLGFFEVLIWLIAIGQIMQNLSNWVNYVAYAGGFALGNYIGMLLEEKLAIGMLAVRIITQKPAPKLIQELQRNKIGTTSIEAKGMKGKVSIIFLIIKRSNLPVVRKIIKQHNPNAFVSINDIRSVQEGYFPKKSHRKHLPYLLHRTSLKRK
jgi:uncharacterized protein YebE (UPF0316 family)